MYTMSGKKASFLIAMPSITDPLFERSVILLSSAEQEGELGIILNKATDADIHRVLSMAEIGPHEYEGLPDLPMLFGGPVQLNYIWALHERGLHTDLTIRFASDWDLTPIEHLLPFLQAGERPYIFHVGVGYSGWGEGQLEHEIEEGSWWQAELDLEELWLHPIDDRWHKALEMMGVHPDELVDKTDPHDPVVN